MPDVRSIPLSDILVDHADSPRAGIDPSHVQDFVELDGNWPPVLVRPQEGEFADLLPWRLADGFHRHAAAQQLGLGSIEAEVAGEDWEIEAIRRNIYGKTLTLRERHDWFNEHRLWEKGKSQRDLARMLGVNHATISMWTNAVSTVTSNRPNDDTPPSPPPTTEELFRRNVEEGVSSVDLGHEYDLNRRTVESLIDREKARRFDREQEEVEILAPYIPPVFVPPVTAPRPQAEPRPQIDIAEQMRLRNIEKSRNELAAEWWGAARKIGLAALTVASEAHQRAMVESEPPERIESALGGIEEEVDLIVSALRATRAMLGGGVGVVVDARVSK